MFEHSVKVPRHYKIAANIFKKVSTEGGSVKTLLYDDKLRHFRTNVLYALITETIKHGADLDKLFESCNLFEKETRLDPWLAKILTTELLFGKKTLPGKSKPEQTILSYKDQFDEYTSLHQDDFKTEAPRRPRYVRVNTNLLTTSDAIRAFQDEGYRFIRCTSGTYSDYLQQIQNLLEDEFTQDYHVKTMFVFSSGTKLHEHELYLENKIILQDKATAMAVHLLAPPPGSVVLDMCAAPGMKTTQLAAYIRNCGKVYAVERNEKRYYTLCDFVTKTNSYCVEPINKDVLEIRRGDGDNKVNMDDVEYILLDPSCSGSGMEFSVHSYIDTSRLNSLTSLQEKFLKHAMNAFPQAKRIVYSTCSLFPEENERVITNVVKTSRAKWRVQNVRELLKDQWQNFGSGMYGSMGSRCMYAKPESDLTTGFFLAVLDRDQKDLEKTLQGLEKAKKDKSKKRDESNDETEMCHEKEVIDDHGDEMELEERAKSKKKNKGKNHVTNEESDLKVDDVEENGVDTGDGSRKKKKKRKNEKEDIADSFGGLLLDEAEVPKKKKKKDKHKDIEETEVNTNNTENVPVNEIESSEVTKKKKKKKKKRSHDIEEIQVDELQSESESVPKKKKKKKDKDVFL